MTNTEFIDYIIQELERSHFKGSSEKELFEMIVFPVSDDVWKKKYKAKWSSWRWRKRVKHNSSSIYTGTHIQSLTKSSDILKAISKKLNFDMSIWNEGDITQKKIIKECVRELLNKSESINFSSLLSPEPKINEKQKQLLEELSSKPKSSIDNLISQNIEFFSQKKENQSFLLELLSVFYEKSYLEILNEKVFPSLLYHHRNRIDVRIKEANTLTNLKNPNYHQIISILQSSEYESAEESIDINTMIVSNMKRGLINSEVKNSDELKIQLLLIIEHYDKVYNSQRPYNYYPAINLVYVVKLFVMIFSDDSTVNHYDFNKVYKSIKASIRLDKKKSENEKYYASITDLEFRLFLGDKNVISDLYILLEVLDPSIRLIEQTLGQMKWFVKLLQKFSKNKKVFMGEFIKVIDILSVVANFQILKMKHVKDEF